MSGCPKDRHKALLYRIERARKFAETASDALGRLWREVGEAQDVMKREGRTPDAIEQAIAAALVEWRKTISDGGWSGVWPPGAIDTLRAIARAGQERSGGV